jgi:hypothetical protein
MLLALPMGVAIGLFPFTGDVARFRTRLKAFRALEEAGARVVRRAEAPPTTMSVASRLAEKLELDPWLSVQSVSFAPTRPEQLDLLRHFPEIEELQLHRIVVDDHVLIRVAAIESLTTLWVGYTDNDLPRAGKPPPPPITDAGVLNLVSLRRLVTLSLEDVDVADETIAELKKMPALSTVTPPSHGSPVSSSG